MEVNNSLRPIRVLLIDDDEEDYLIIKRLFVASNSNYSQIDWVSSSDKAIEIISEGSYDAYLVDYRIDGRTGLDLLKEVNAIEKAEPFILLTGVGDVDIERESLRYAASDYLIKKNLTSDNLARTLYYALGRKEQEKQKIEHLIELNKSKDEFISIASHQLRTPATAVKQYIAMVLDGYSGDLTNKQEAILTKAYQSNERQLAIINNLLKVAQIDSGVYTPIFETRIINKIVSEAVEDFSTYFAEHDQQLNFINSVDVTCSVDETAVRMIIDNLLENASKYSKEETTTIVKVTIDTSEVSICVTDQGVGVSEPDKLFNKFSRIDNELSTEVGGTGLGLYWAKSVAELHGGNLRYESVDKTGSRFILSLPIVK